MAVFGLRSTGEAGTWLADDKVLPAEYWKHRKIKISRRTSVRILVGDSRTVID
jgi:hypothetical protein